LSYNNENKYNTFDAAKGGVQNRTEQKAAEDN
jgi:hypothetical protein